MTTSSTTQQSLLIEGLCVTYRGRVEALKDVSLTLYPGQSLAIAGRSGSGKSTLAACILGLLGPRAVVKGRVVVAGIDVNQATKDELRRLRGRVVGYVGQNPYAAFDPLFRLGFQLEEACVADDVAVADALRLAGLEPTRGLLRSYPHELSGGMLQRAQLAAAILNRPSLLVLDEPTGALDPVSRLALARLIQDLRAKMTLVLITHDIGLAARLAEDIAFLHDGRVVACGKTAQVLAHPGVEEVHALLSAWRRTSGVA